MRTIDADDLIAVLEHIEQTPSMGLRGLGLEPLMSIKDIKALVQSRPTIEPKRKYESRALLPCKCGCKRREYWVNADSDKPDGLKCIRCGFTVWGKNATDVRRKWNEAVRNGTTD